MSVEEAKRFLDQVDNDQELQQKLKEANANFAKIAQEHGYDVTQQDLHAHMRERWSIGKPPSYDDPDTTTYSAG